MKTKRFEFNTIAEARSFLRGLFEGNKQCFSAKVEDCRIFNSTGVTTVELIELETVDVSKGE